MTTTPEALFVCVHNAGRSQMAAALLKHRAGGRVHVKSAGSEPADRVNPAVVEVPSGIGFDVSKGVDEVRKIRDGIDLRVRTLLVQLTSE